MEQLSAARVVHVARVQHPPSWVVGLLPDGPIGAPGVVNMVHELAKTAGNRLCYGSYLIRIWALTSLDVRYDSCGFAGLITRIQVLGQANLSSYV